MPQRSMRLTTPLPLILVGVVLVMQLANPHRVWSWLLTALVVINVIGYVWARQLRDGVVANRVMRGTWVVAGDVLFEEFQLSNKSLAPILWAELVDGSDVPGYSADRVEGGIWPGDQRRWQMRGVCRQRGLFTVGPWELQMGDPLGLFRITLHYDDSRTLLVYPRVMHLPSLSLPRGIEAGRSRSTRPSPLPQVAASNVRQHAPGDALRLVHWPTTAHSGVLMVREFDLDPSGNLWIVLDLDRRVQAGEAPESTEEYGVILTASLAAEMLGQNRAVGLCVSGEEPVLMPPRHGQAQLWRMLHLLAGIRAQSDRPLADTLRETGPSLGRGLTVVIITPSIEANWITPLLPLTRRGIATAAILLDRVSFTADMADAATADYLALRGVLADHGVSSHVIRKGFPFTPVIRHKRRRVVQKVLWGTGRVVTVEVEEEV